MTYAEVALNVPVHNTYSYHIPEELIGELQVGHLVRVSFRTAIEPAIVIALHDTTDIAETKPILERLDPQPVISPQQLELAEWMRDQYLAPLGMCLWLFMPPMKAGRRTTHYRLLDPKALRTDSLQQAIINRLNEHGALQLAQLKRMLKDKLGTQESVNALLKANIITEEAILAPPPKRRSTQKFAALTIEPDHIPNIVKHLGKNSAPANLLEVVAALPDDPIGVEDALRLADAKRSALNRLQSEGAIFVEKTERSEQNLIFLNGLSEGEVDDMLIALRGGDKYLPILNILAEAKQALETKHLLNITKSTQHTLSQLVERGLVALHEQIQYRDSLADRDFVPAIAPKLTHEQQQVWDVVHEPIQAWVWEDADSNTESTEQSDHIEAASSLSAKNKTTFLLHGVTGSGKTEIYLRAIEATLAQGRQAIFSRARDCPNRTDHTPSHRTLPGTGRSSTWKPETP